METPNHVTHTKNFSFRSRFALKLVMFSPPLSVFRAAARDGHLWRNVHRGVQQMSDFGLHSPPFVAQQQGIRLDTALKKVPDPIADTWLIAAEFTREAAMRDIEGYMAEAASNPRLLV